MISSRVFRVLQSRGWSTVAGEGGIDINKENKRHADTNQSKAKHNPTEQVNNTRNDNYSKPHMLHERLGLLDEWFDGSSTIMFIDHRIIKDGQLTM